MSNQPKSNLVKRGIYLHPDDIATLQRFFPKVGWTVAARNIIHSACRKLVEQENKAKEPDDDQEIRVPE